jgi:hypothetical protein
LAGRAAVDQDAPGHSRGREEDGQAATRLDRKRDVPLVQHDRVPRAEVARDGRKGVLEIGEGDVAQEAPENGPDSIARPEPPSRERGGEQPTPRQAARDGVDLADRVAPRGVQRAHERTAARARDASDGNSRAGQHVEDADVRRAPRGAPAERESDRARAPLVSSLHDRRVV